MSKVRILTAEAAVRERSALVETLADRVAGGASVRFIWPSYPCNLSPASSTMLIGAGADGTPAEGPRE
jgi:hypothetical protein